MKKNLSKIRLMMEQSRRVLNYGIFGDICGSSIESRFGNDFKDLFELFNRGMMTDDSEMTLAVYDCIRNGKISSIDFMNSFSRRCRNRRSYSAKTLSMIDSYRENFSGRNCYDTNGAIMRSSPFILISDPELRKSTMENSMIHTHYNRSAADACMDYVSYLRLLMTKGKQHFIHIVDRNLKFRIMVSNMALKGNPEVPACFAPNGFTTTNADTFAYAYHYFINHDEKTYEEGLIKLLRTGGDTDTLAKIYCEMVGCVSNCFDKYITRDYFE